MNVITFEDLPNIVSEILEKVNNIDRQLRVAGDVPGRTEDGLLTISGAGELLNLSKNTIYKLVQKGVLPYSKKSKRLYFVKKELLDWVKSGKKLTKDELLEEAEAGFINANKSRG